MKIGQVHWQGRLTAAVFRDGEAHPVPGYTVAELIESAPRKNLSFAQMAAEYAARGGEYLEPSIPVLPREVWASGCTYEMSAAFRDAALRLASDRRPKEQRLADLRRFDPAEAFLSLRVLDPAMGSGHFLVSLVDWLTDETLAAQQEAAALVPWGEYASPLSAKIEAIRAHIRAQAQSNGWELREDHLDDRHLVRRIVLKRVIYGADLNPMAVELAKLSLWLHSFTVGAPLSFLDHHLRTGDSLFGEFVHQAEERIRQRARCSSARPSCRPARPRAG